MSVRANQGKLIAPLSITSAELTTGIKKTKQAKIPSKPHGIDDYPSWEQIVIKNATPWRLKFVTGNPTQGIYFVNPKGIDAFSVDSFTVANANTDQGKILGTRGGNAWAVAMDDNTELPLAIGWSVTATGVVQNGLVFSTDRQAGFQANSASAQSIDSKDGYTVKASDQVIYDFVIRAADTNPDDVTIVTVEFVPK